MGGSPHEPLRRAPYFAAGLLSMQLFSDPISSLQRAGEASLSIALLCEILHLVSEITARRRRWQGLAVFVIQGDRLLHDLA